MNKKLFIGSAIFLILAFGFLLINLPNIAPVPNFDDLDSGSLLDGLYAILLAGLVMFIAAGFGSIIIRPFRLSAWTFPERAVISLPLGLAAIGYGEFLFGLIGWIRPLHQIIFLLFIAGISFKNSVLFLKEGLSAVVDFRHTWQTFSRVKKIFFVIGCMALLLAFIQTFTPAFDYDGLMYHLQGPRLFLEAGKIIPIPENWFTYYPATWEMLYMLGMSLGSDIFARLITFATLLIFILVTYLSGKRLLGPAGGWLSAAIIIGTPMMLSWGGCAYIDLAWSLFQFLAVGLLLIWVQEREGKYLVLSGIMQGLALGSKYTAFSGAGILGLCLVWCCVQNFIKKEGVYKGFIRPLLFFILPAALVASPWYLKNLIWTGNPVFPLFLEQDIINPTELQIWLDYLASFGTGTHWYDYILLPYTIFSHYYKYSTFIIFWDAPNPVLLLSLGYPFVRKRLKKNRKALDLLAVFTALGFIVWALGSQQNRFLMPLFPGMSILSCIVIMNLPIGRVKINWSRIFSIGVIGGLVICSFVLMGRFTIMTKSIHVVLGVESVSTYISYIAKDFTGIKYINENLSDNALVFMPWDGRGYYCDGKCYPDISQSKWTALIQEMKSIQDVSAWFQAEDITHVMISMSDIAFFVYRHDPDGIHLQAYRYLVDNYAPLCAELIYEDDWNRLYELHLEYNNCK